MDVAAFVGGVLASILGIIIALISASNGSSHRRWRRLQAVSWPVPFALAATILCAGSALLPVAAVYFVILYAALSLTSFWVLSRLRRARRTND